jgi:hypothetical protein
MEAAARNDLAKLERKLWSLVHQVEVFLASGVRTTSFGLSVILRRVALGCVEVAKVYCCVVA